MDYIGNELTLFAKATNWKNYYGSFLLSYLRGKVLEVGAGLGGTTLSLCDGSQSRWLCLEPDSKLAQNINQLISEKKLPKCCTCKIGTLKDISYENKLFNAVLYIDVIEHVENDKAELELASHYIVNNGFLIIVVPAHQFLYSAFDKTIGHFRRYSRKQLLSIIPQKFNIKKAIYLDSMGLFVSLVNKIFMKQNYPTEKQIYFWDRLIVRLSILIDTFFFYNFGKSVLVIAQKTND